MPQLIGVHAALREQPQGDPGRLLMDRKLSSAGPDGRRHGIVTADRE